MPQGEPIGTVLVGGLAGDSSRPALDGQSWVSITSPSWSCTSSGYQGSAEDRLWRGRPAPSGAGLFGHGRRLRRASPEQDRQLAPASPHARPCGPASQRFWHADQVNDALDERTRQLVNAELPEQVQLIRIAETADQTAKEAMTAYFAASAANQRRATILHAASGRRGVADELSRLTERTTTAGERLVAAEHRIDHRTTTPPSTAGTTPNLSSLPPHPLGR